MFSCFKVLSCYKAVVDDKKTPKDLPLQSRWARKTLTYTKRPPILGGFGGTDTDEEDEESSSEDRKSFDVSDCDSSSFSGEAIR